MKVLCIEDEAFFFLLERVYDKISEKHNLAKIENKYIDAESAMSLLGIKSKTTLAKLRREGKILFTQPQRKVILYNRDSIISYLDSHVRQKF